MCTALLGVSSEAVRCLGHLVAENEAQYPLIELHLRKAIEPDTDLTID